MLYLVTLHCLWFVCFASDALLLFMRLSFGLVWGLFCLCSVVWFGFDCFVTCLWRVLDYSVCLVLCCRLLLLGLVLFVCF